MSVEHSFLPEFKYKHNNPYHERLAGYSDFVLRDLDAEQFKGKWRAEVFKNAYPLVAEIGTGYGHFMMQYCQDHPQVNFVGIDYRFKRSFHLAQKLESMQIKNFRYLRARGERINYIFDADELDQIYYFFPDPWPKTKHNKKRLFQAPFLEACLKVLKVGGNLYIKTDHDDYFRWMQKHVENFKSSSEKAWELTFKSHDLYSESNPPEVLAKYITKFENIFLKKKMTTKAMILTCKSVN